MNSAVLYTNLKGEPSMNRLLTYQIAPSDAGLRVEQFLRRQGFSRQNLVELKKMPESILVNGYRYRLNQTLSADDELIVHIQEETSSEKIPPIPLPLDIIFEDEDLLVVNKPAGMPIHPSRGNYYNSLANALAWHYARQGKPFIFRCTNRLDRDTSGLTIVAKHMVSSNILSHMAKHHEIERNYLAIVRGSIFPKSGTIDAPLSRKPGSVIERTIDFTHGERAVTHYQVVDEKKGHSLVSLCLETGRTHQIRIHMKHLGHPLIGDYLYNPDMEYMTRQALHSARLHFTHPVTRENMVFSVPLPADMQTFGWEFSLPSQPPCPTLDQL